MKKEPCLLQPTPTHIHTNHRHHNMVMTIVRQTVYMAALFNSMIIMAVLCHSVLVSAVFCNASALCCYVRVFASNAINSSNNTTTNREKLNNGIISSNTLYLWKEMTTSNSAHVHKYYSSAACCLVLGLASKQPWRDFLTTYIMPCSRMHVCIWIEQN